MDAKRVKGYLNLEKLTYIFFGIYMATLLLNSTVPYLTIKPVNHVVKITRYVCYFVFVIKIILDWKNGSSITWTTIIFSVFSILIFIFTKNKDIIFLLIVLLSLKKLDIDKLIKLTLVIYVVLYFIIVGLSLLGIIPDWIYTYRANTIRHSFGFNFATILIGYYLSIVLMYFYVRKSKCKYLELLLLEIVNIFLYENTNGRLSFILITVILLIMFLSKIKIFKKIFHSKIIQKLVRLVSYILPISLFIIFNVMTYLYGTNNEIIIKINDLISNRIELTYKAFNSYKLTPFGEKIEWIGWGGHGYIDLEENKKFDYNYVDSSYAKMIFDYGLIFSILVIIAYTIVLVKNYKQKNYWMLFSLYFVLIWSFIEPYIITIGKNNFILVFISLLEIGPIYKLDYKNKKDYKIEDKNHEKVNN